MRGRTDAQLSRIGTIAVLVALLLMVAALNLQKFPGFRGTEYEAEFTDASGLHKGNMVQIAGIRVGRVSGIDLAGDHVVVHFTVDPGHTFGQDTKASIDVLNLLGEKYLDLDPAGSGKLEAGSTIPLDRTDSSYDIVKVFTGLANTTERIDVPQLRQALDVVSGTMNRTSGEARATFTGLSRLSTSIASRDSEIQSLLQRARSVSELLSARKGDVVALIREGDQILQELRTRRAAIHALLVHTRELATQLGGLVDDNQKQIGPMLASLRNVSDLLVQRETQLRAIFHNMGPYTRILSNVIGTGPWFDAYASNFFALPSGEFQPGYKNP